MKVFINILKNIFYSLPVQLFILHFRKYQVLLIFWFLLFSTVGGSFMKLFGADALFLTPEYLGSVNMLAAFISGLALGVFIMSWNITTFILHSRRLKFLATTPDPFLRYCINNGIIPLIFLGYYFCRIYSFGKYRELLSGYEIIGVIAGITGGVLLLILFSFAYFFGAGKTIERSMIPVISNPELFNKKFKGKENRYDGYALKAKWYLSARFRIKQCRDVTHYRQDFLDTIFKRHHLAAIISILIAFILVVVGGFLLDYRIFEMPAAASIMAVFALLIALIGALSYFLQSWSLPAVILILGGLNFLFEKGIIDPRNKAYGLNYNNRSVRPLYNKGALQLLCTKDKIDADKANMIKVLQNWKAKQGEEKPLMVFINVSGGGLRSAAFTMNALQKSDSITGGSLMKHTFMISGASGGMLAATYYRELYAKKNADPKLNIADISYTENISRDLLNPVFSSLMARDIFTPMQKFSVGNNQYVKDRGYAFEKKLSDNSEGLLNRQIKDLRDDEFSAKVPLIIFNAVIKSDARKMMISTQPLSFMMKPVYMQKDSTASPDAVDFAALLHDLDPMELRMLTALRMNATFPYVLPNVWLPTNPVIDVMDAGLRDNYGQETTMRFMENFKSWIAENTSGVLILQFRDRLNDNWQQPFETKSFTDMAVTPATMLQHNWFKLQDYYQNQQYDYFAMDSSLKMHKALFMYQPQTEEKAAALNFHITSGERKDVIASFNSAHNQEVVKLLKSMLVK